MICIHRLMFFLCFQERSLDYVMSDRERANYYHRQAILAQLDREEVYVLFASKVIKYFTKGVFVSQQLYAKLLQHLIEKCM